MKEIINDPIITEKPDPAIRILFNPENPGAF